MSELTADASTFVAGVVDGHCIAHLDVRAHGGWCPICLLNERDALRAVCEALVARSSTIYAAGSDKEPDYVIAARAALGGVK